MRRMNGTLMTTPLDQIHKEEAHLLIQGENLGVGQKVKIIMMKKINRFKNLLEVSNTL